MTSSRPYQPFRSYGKNVPPPAYALLADLQKTTSNLNTSTTYQSPSSPDNTNTSYGSLGSPHQFQYNMAYSPAAAHTTHSVTTERCEYGQGEKNSPIYQNQQVIREITTTTTSPRSHQPSNPNLSSNLSELDTLLEDLNSARFMNYADKKAPQMVANGPSTIPHYNDRETSKPTSPTTSNSYISQDGRPTVESLLDELQSAVPKNSSYGRMNQPVQCNQVVTMVSHESHVQPQIQTSSPVPTASSATKELDDLMASLSDFKLNTTPSPNHVGTSDPAYAKPQKPSKSPGPTSNRSNQLDSMLGTLRSDMSRQGITTTAKGHCAACHKPIVGQVVTALGKTWHPEHFTCTHCNLELGTKNFFERDGEPYCEKDYHNIFSPRCAYCNGPILDKCVTALDKTWHPDHFFCTQCGRQFGDDGFHERDGKPYCREDYFDMFAPKCGGCNRPITENYISALNSQWHPECFVCRDCRQPFNGGSFYDHEGQPYCETHYHAKRGSLCAGCHKPITGRCVTAMFRKFHPEHFVCSFCLKQLNKGTFKEQNDKPYCHACFEKLFG
uniref:Paxillin n=1 Tax=Hadrurus spadix TaxID=141984 RepID=A0A1W7RA34_9SCOR